MVVLRYTETDGTERTLDVDAVVREGETLQSEITEHPVERGAPVADHAYDKLDSLVLEFVITNTPTRVPESHMSGVGGSFRSSGGAVVLSFDSQFDRVREVETDLRRIKSAALLWNVSTGLRDYNEFIIEQIAIERTEGRGSSAKFTVTLRKFRFVTTSVAAVPHRQRRTRPPVSRGQQPPQPPRASVLHGWFGRGS